MKKSVITEKNKDEDLYEIIARVKKATQVNPPTEQKLKITRTMRLYAERKSLGMPND